LKGELLALQRRKPGVVANLGELQIEPRTAEKCRQIGAFLSALQHNWQLMQTSVLRA
jgi:hypothetical protein